MIRAALLAAALLAFGCATAKGLVVETIHQDIDGDGKPDSVTLSLTTEPNEPGDFNRIALSLTASGKHFTFEDDGLWIPIHRNDLGSSPRRSVANLMHSNKLILAKAVEGDYLLMMIGYLYASDPQKLTVIRLSKAGAKVVLSHEMDLEEFGDIDHDGKTDIVGAMVSEPMGPDCHSYDPDVVYSLRDTFRFNRRLTERYDRQHDGFYAADDKKYLVMERQHGKRELLPESEFNRCSK